MGSLFFDLRHCVRRLVREPGFTVAAVLTLALGIGANAALFTLLNAVFLRPTPGVDAPERLAAIYTSDYSGPAYGGSSYPDYEAIAGAKDVFSAVAAYAQRVAAVGDPGAPVRVGVEVVSPGYFEVMGLHVRGRVLSGEDAEIRARVAVVSDAFWRTHLAQDGAAIGRTILVNARPVTVIGIAPPGYRGVQRGFSVDLWLPASVGAEFGLGVDVEQRGSRGLLMMARMRPGVAIEQARARLKIIAAQLHSAYPDAWTDLRGEGRRLTVESERKARVHPGVRGPVVGFAALLSAMVGIVLLICCANLAGLMLARVMARGRELAIRRSLGATQSRVRMVLMTETLLLAIAGGAAGLVLSIWTVRLLLGLIPDTLPVPIAIAATPDLRVFTFTAVIAMAAALLFGMAPALRAGRADLTTMLKGDADAQLWRGRGRRVGLREFLVGGQVAASIVLLVTAMLFLRSLRAAATVDLGYKPDGIVVLDFEPQPGQEPNDAARAIAVSAVAQRLAALPDVAAASWAQSAPLGFDAGNRRSTSVEGYASAPGEDMEFHYNVVGPDYFETMGLPLVRGRGFTWEDRSGAPGVIVVSERFARRFWQGNDAIGKRVSLTGEAGDYLTVIGVARDAKLVSIGSEPMPYMYLPALQMVSGSVLHVRTSRDPAAVLSAINAVLPEAAPNWSVRNARTMEAQVATSVLPQRVAGRALTAFGLLALILAAVGLYGIVAFAVAQRTRELGIRVALGASAHDVIRVTIAQGIRIVIIGTVAGLLLAFAASRLIASLLPGMSPNDPVSFVVATIVLMAATMIAMYVPARRATAVDPIAALRR